MFITGDSARYDGDKNYWTFLDYHDNRDKSEFNASKRYMMMHEGNKPIIDSDPSLKKNWAVKEMEYKIPFDDHRFWLNYIGRIDKQSAHTSAIQPQIQRIVRGEEKEPGIDTMIRTEIRGYA